MKTGSHWNEISLVAIAGILCWGCTLTSPSQDASMISSGGGVSGYDECPGGAQDGGDTTESMLPCDIYAAHGGSCVAAHSTVRTLVGAYTGPLYQVKKLDNSTMDIFAATPGGMANGDSQDAFCGSAACTISIIYDQSGMHNDLKKAPAGMARPMPDNEANAKSAGITIGGHKLYGVHIVTGVGYRNNAAVGTATGDNPETEYMVVSSAPYNGSCCFDYGNMETTSRDDGEGTMEAVYFGNCTIWGRGAGPGPWIMGDLENGLWAGNKSPYMDNKPITNWTYVTGMVKGGEAGANHWTIKAGNAQCGALIVPFDGQRPSSHYIPMRKQGAIGLGTGGDNSAGATGNWFEGVMTTTYAPDEADDAVQRNIVAFYGQQ